MVNLRVHSQSVGIRARPVYLLDGALKRRYEYNSDGTVKYVGEAEDVTALTSQAKWRIKKMSYNGGFVVSEDWADGSNDFDKVWDDRASYSYG